MSDYCLITKFFNENEGLPKLIRNISNQTKEPKKLIFIDDGSNDGSKKIAANLAKAYGFEFEQISMPEKEKGNLDLLGKAWNKAQPLIRAEAEQIEYFALADVDTRFPCDYFERMTSFLDDNPEFGVVAGQVRGESHRTFPMFTGKVVRSDIMKEIKTYWDISVDSFINVKAMKRGYKLKILDDLEVDAPRSHLTAGSGRFRAGRLAYYAGVKPAYAIFKAIVKRDSNFMRGYWSEFYRGRWRTTDKDILEYYQGEFLRKAIGFINKLFG